MLYPAAMDLFHTSYCEQLQALDHSPLGCRSVIGVDVCCRYFITDDQLELVPECLVEAEAGEERCAALAAASSCKAAQSVPGTVSSDATSVALPPPVHCPTGLPQAQQPVP